MVIAWSGALLLFTDSIIIHAVDDLMQVNNRRYALHAE